MNNIFKDMIIKGIVIIYLDDILIFAEDLEMLRERIWEVLKRLQENDLYLRPEKCKFEKEEVEYLGILVRKGEIKMDPKKVEVIEKWPIPKNVKEVRGFIGFINFY